MTVVALIPTKDGATSVGATVGALRAVTGVDRVLVIDDGSVDDSVASARAAGAEVLRLPRNRGKGGAVLAGVAATPEADIYLLLDADLAATAGVADRLLDPVRAGNADMTIGVLPPAGAKGGFGRVRDLARRGIRRACGREMRAPLSGQRAVRADLLRDLPSAERFGLEVALTIDAVRAGARVVEVDVQMDHRHTGRSVGGFRHRAAQGVDIVRSLWPRVTSARQRIALGAVIAVVIGALALWSGNRWVPPTTTLPESSSTAASTVPSSAASKVVVFGMAPLGFRDLETGHTPVLDRLMTEGAVGAMSVRTVSRRPNLAEGYLSLGAGYRLSARDESGEAYPVEARLGTATAAEVLESRSGFVPTGDIAVVGGANALDLNRDRTITSKPGALADALAGAGKSAAVVGNADQPRSIDGNTIVNRPAALAVMNRTLSVARGTVQADDLLLDDPLAPFGVRADPDKVMTALEAAGASSDVIVVDPGDLSRAEAFVEVATNAAARQARFDALERSDALLDRVVTWAGKDALVLVVSVSPGGDAFRLTPVVATGAGVPEGYLFSPSTKRSGIVALTDLAPTILDAVGVPVPDTMPGHALRYNAGKANLQMLQEHDRDTAFREQTYYPWAVWFIVSQAFIYLLVALVVSRGSRLERTGPILRVVVLGAASFPLATFVFRMIPDFSALGWATTPVLLSITAAIALLVSRARRHPLSSLNLVMAATVGVIAVDASTGTWLHVDSWLGYSLHSAGRFYGIPNTTFAVLAASALLLSASRVQFAARRGEAVLGAVALLSLVVLIDGAPSLGGDVGGIITLVPLFGLTIVALSGRRLRPRMVVLLVAATVVAVAVATTADVLRPEDAQTHLGRFATRLFEEGPSQLSDTFLRKQSANLRILKVSIWTWMIPILTGFMLYVLVWERQLRNLLPTGSPLRAGVVAGVSGALLGFLANDSGPIVIALFFVYILPYLALLALSRREGAPVLLAPDPPKDEDETPPPVLAADPVEVTAAAVGGGR